MRGEASESEQEVEGLRFAARFTRRTAPPRSFSIRRLVAAVLAGNEDAFEQVYMQFYDRLYARLSRDLRDPHEGGQTPRRALSAWRQDDRCLGGHARGATGRRPAGL